MKIVILGGTGFIGSNILKVLTQEKNHEITLLSRKKISIPGVRCLQGDWKDSSVLESILEKDVLVYHLITATHPAHPNQTLANDIQENVIPTVQLLEICSRKKIGKIIYLSSAGTIYGTPTIVPIPESHDLNPLSSYGLSKLAIEKHLHYFYHHHGLDYVSVRLTNPYGPGQDFQTGLGAITNFIDKTLKGIPLEVWGDGSIRRDYIYIDDVVDALTKFATIKTSSKIFNLGTGHGLTINQLIAVLEGKFGKKIAVNYKEKRGIDVQDNTVDISLIKKELSWAPQFTIEQGLDKYLSYYKTKGQS